MQTINGDEFLIEGNSSKIKEYFTPSISYQNLDGKNVKTKRAFGNFIPNEMLKEIAPCHYDEKIQIGHGLSEHYFINKNNKIMFR